MRLHISKFRVPPSVTSECQVQLPKGCVSLAIPAHKPRQTILRSPKLQARFQEAHNQSFTGGTGQDSIFPTCINPHYNI